MVQIHIIELIYTDAPKLQAQYFYFNTKTITNSQMFLAANLADVDWRHIIIYF